VATFMDSEIQVLKLLYQAETSLISVQDSLRILRHRQFFIATMRRLMVSNTLARLFTHILW
jgi:hypothetical protein